MRIWFATLFLFFNFLAVGSSCFSQDYIEVDFNDQKVKFSDFHLGSYTIYGIFSFALNKQANLFTLNLEGRNIKFSEKNFSSVKLNITKAHNTISVHYFSLPGGGFGGMLDLDKGEVALEVDGSWQSKNRFLAGDIRTKAKAWGELNNFLVCGYFVVTDCMYQGNEFLQFRVDFLGKPPLLNITDSELILKDGSIVKVEGLLDLRNFSNLLPSPEFKAQKVYLDKWQLFSEDNKIVGLKKNVDNKLGVSLNADGQTENTSGPQTELRYELQRNNFLELKSEDKATTLRFERRNDF